LKELYYQLLNRIHLYHPHFLYLLFEDKNLIENHHQKYSPSEPELPLFTSAESTRQQSPIRTSENDDLAQDLAQLSTTELVPPPLSYISSTYIPVTTVQVPPPPINTHPVMGQQEQKELNIAAPVLFTGKKEQFNRWVQAVQLFLEANDHIYRNDKLQIFYALSRILDGGETGVWKENWQTAKIAGGNFGTFAAFIQEFREALSSVTSADNAMRKLKSLRMESNSADEHTGKFNLLIDKAGMANAGAPVLIDFY